jgi:hypothetical protein
MVDDVTPFPFGRTARYRSILQDEQERRAAFLARAREEVVGAEPHKRTALIGLAGAFDELDILARLALGGALSEDDMRSLTISALEWRAPVSPAPEAQIRHLVKTIKWAIAEAALCLTENKSPNK